MADTEAPNSTLGDDPILPQEAAPPPPTIQTNPPPSSPLTEELRAEIVRQVEFYFSDANLPTDDFLLKQLSRSPEGWVPLRVITSFHKMKKLIAGNLSTLVAALHTSTELLLSDDNLQVRRLAALPIVDLDEVRSRSVIAWNLPEEKPRIGNVIEMFSAAGTVAMARIRKPEHPEPLIKQKLKAEMSRAMRDYYALIEYSTVEEAVRAVELLNDESSWRSGLKVKSLHSTASISTAAPGGGSSSSTKTKSNKGRKKEKKIENAALQQISTKEEGNEEPEESQSLLVESKNVENALRLHQPPANGDDTTTTTTAAAAAVTGGREAREARTQQQQQRKNRAHYTSWTSGTAAAAASGNKEIEEIESQHSTSGVQNEDGDNTTGAAAAAAAAGGGGGASASGRQPRMPPVGLERGFTLGRGKPLEHGNSTILFYNATLGMLSSPSVVAPGSQPGGDVEK